MGGWALGMRAMMVTTHGEDYVTYADAKGLKGNDHLPPLPDPPFPPAADHRACPCPRPVDLRRAARRGIFSYPGIGTVLFHAIRGSDYYLIQGIVFILIVSIGLTTLILDLIYPLLDPRITYQQRFQLPVDE